ncbi:hypothetical protein ACSBL2_24600 [Pedobacter sp. AW31-3R]|uniref:hypothetical protein n=1 Tax=Pedobacter sp. AW31-3R TaxID=3445781 RepID=UPI003FA01F05
MLKPIVHIAITNPVSGKLLEFDFVNEVQIQKSLNALTKTCNIKLPRKLLVLQGDINTILKRGSTVVVKLGYNGELRTEFTGYIARLGAKTPMEIFCEDEMWILKQNSFSKAWKNVQLAEIIRYVYKGRIRVPDHKLDSFVIKKQSTAEVLESLKNKAKIRCYFDSDNVLVAGFNTATSTKTDLSQRAIYDFNVNVIENDLEYIINDTLKIKVTGISKLSTGKIIEHVIGDADGKNTDRKYNNINQKTLEENVKREFEKLKGNKYKNSFKTFGIPYTEPGFTAVMNDKKYPEREGSYLIESVNTTFGTGGFRRQITLDTKTA